MKIDIKFRGIKKSDGEMIYGDFNYFDGKVYIFNREGSFNSTDDYEVIPETVGQFTGLKDKNGNEIYEGDYDQDMQVVRWCDKRNGWSLSIYDFPTQEHICCHCYNCEGNYDLNDVLHEIEIIGNIYEKK
jgi:uncharacterized phage protein (TIGR01671 family)